MLIKYYIQFFNIYVKKYREVDDVIKNSIFLLLYIDVNKKDEAEYCK